MPWVGSKFFAKLLESLPAEEQETFRSFRHPCQDDGYTGLNTARFCADGLNADLKNCAHLKGVEIGFSGGEFILVAVLAEDCGWAPVPYYRGFLVRSRHENSPK